MSQLVSHSLQQAPTEVSSGELTHLNYRRFLPNPVLRPWVQCYWSARLHRAPQKQIVEHMYPDGGVSITFNLRDTDKHWFSAKQSLHTLVVQEPMDSFGVRFHPAGVHWLLQRPMSEINQQPYSLKDLQSVGIPFLSGVEQLNEQLIEAISIQQGVTLVDSWLFGRWQKIQPEINTAQQVLSHWSIVDEEITGWCQRNNVSRRTIERAFKQFMGVSPGRFKLLYQVRLARESIKRQPRRSLTQLSHALGFYDQAHFTRHFRSVTGQTPGKYRQRQLESFLVQ